MTIDVANWIRRLFESLNEKTTRRQPPPTLRPEPKSIHTKVIGAFVPGHVRVCMGYGVGMLDGGVDIEVPIEHIPLDLRVPNSEFMLQFDAEHKITGIERIASPRFGDQIERVPHEV
jgi:hypothetical protein